jgi:hypothetical protein
VAAKKQSSKSKYDPAMCERMVELGKTGASQKMIWSDLGISKSTAESYKKAHPEFAEALDLALVHSQSFWETQILANLENKAFNSRLAEIALRGQFASDYKESRDTKIDLKAEIKVDFQKEINELLTALKS